jgi:ribonucleoside-diphosphate reductase alpha chain
VQWELRTASIGNDKGRGDLRAARRRGAGDWSQTATNIVVSKYFYGKMGSPERETSVRQLVGRVVDTIAEWGQTGATSHAPTTRELPRRAGAPDADAEGLLQLAGVVQRGREGGARLRLVLRRSDRPDQESWKGETRPQCSACFINSVGDTLESILDLAKTEGMLFKWGSGTGTNLSTPARRRTGCSRAADALPVR